MAEAESIYIEVVYPLPEEQVLYKLEVPLGTTIKEGIASSGVLERYAELEPETMKVGIFGKLAKLDTLLRAKDRIEIYRPLIADPKEVRKRRAAEGKRMKKGGGNVKDVSTEQGAS